MEWNDETIARLRLFWAEGLSTAEIGRRMGISKNAVVGKAHRLLLAPRPSPIRREPDGTRTPRPSVPRRLVGPTLPSLAVACVVAPSVAAGDRLPPAEAPKLRSEVVDRPVRPVTIAPRPLGMDRRRNVACCWPIGEPGTRSFRFCDADSVHGKPYCTTHAALAYVKVRDRREDAA